MSSYRFTLRLSDEAASSEDATRFQVALYDRLRERHTEFFLKVFRCDYLLDASGDEGYDRVIWRDGAELNFSFWDISGMCDGSSQLAAHWLHHMTVFERADVEALAAQHGLRLAPSDETPGAFLRAPSGPRFIELRGSPYRFGGQGEDMWIETDRVKRVRLWEQLTPQEQAAVRDQQASGLCGCRLCEASREPLVEGPINPAERAWTLELIAAWLAEGGDPDAADAQGNPPLHAAIAAGKSRPAGKIERAVEALLAAGADVNAAGARGRSALEIALRTRENNPIALRLIEQGARIDGRTSEGKALLPYALESGNTRAAKALLDKGFPTAGLRGYDKVICAIFTNDIAQLQQLTARAIPSKPQNRPPAAVVAVLFGSHEALTLLVNDKKRGYDWPDARAALVAAIQADDLPAIEIILAGGLSDLPEMLFDRPLRKKRWDIVERLSASGAPLSIALTGLLAADPLDIAAIDHLLSGRALLRYKDQPNRYHVAALIHRGEIDLLKRLNARGLDLSIRLDGGENSLIDVAQEAGRGDLVPWLTERITEKVVEEWRSLLARYRQPWPEWAELERLAAGPGITWFAEGGEDWLRVPTGGNDLLVEVSPVPSLPEGYSPPPRFGTRRSLPTFTQYMVMVAEEAGLAPKDKKEPAKSSGTAPDSKKVVPDL